MLGHMHTQLVSVSEIRWTPGAHLEHFFEQNGVFRFTSTTPAHPLPYEGLSYPPFSLQIQIAVKFQGWWASGRSTSCGLSCRSCLQSAKLNGARQLHFCVCQGQDVDFGEFNLNVLSPAQACQLQGEGSLHGSDAVHLPRVQPAAFVWH